MNFISVILAANNPINLSRNVSRETSLLEEAIRVYKSNKTIIVCHQSAKKLLEGLVVPNTILANYLESDTKGALISLAMTVENLTNDSPILVCPVDGLVKMDIDTFVNQVVNENHSAGVVCFPSTSKIYSYVRNYEDKVIEIAEKEVISNLATTGLFVFRNKQILLECIEWSLLNKVQTDGKYYVAPSLNYLISTNRSIAIKEIPSNHYYRFSNPEDFDSIAERWSE